MCICIYFAVWIAHKWNQKSQKFFGNPHILVFVWRIWLWNLLSDFQQPTGQNTSHWALIRGSSAILERALEWELEKTYLSPGPVSTEPFYDLGQSTKSLWNLPHFKRRGKAYFYLRVVLRTKSHHACESTGKVRHSVCVPRSEQDHPVQSLRFQDAVQSLTQDVLSAAWLSE